MNKELVNDGHGGTKSKSQKMNKFQSFFALCKLYCAINVLLVPKAFKNAGYLASPLIVLVSCSL